MFTSVSMSSIGHCCGSTLPARMIVTASTAAMTRPTPIPQMMDGVTHAPRDECCVRTIGVPERTPPPIRGRHEGRWRRASAADRPSRSGLLDLAAELLGLALSLEGRGVQQLAGALLDAALRLVERAARLALGLAHVLLGAALGLQRVVAGQLAQALLQAAHHLVLTSGHCLYLQV